MKQLLSILTILFLFGISNAQKAGQYSKTEKRLIKTNRTEMMRVYNLSNPSDSIVLKSISEPIRPKNKITKLLAERMLMSVNDPDNMGVGIAAPQVGINRRMILVQRFDKIGYPFEVFLNPKIISASKEWQRGPEGDLSFDQRGQVMRHFSVDVSYQNLKGETITETIKGFTAVIFQHERDHLDGILLTDRIDEQKEMKFEPITGESNLYELNSEN